MGLIFMGYVFQVYFKEGMVMDNALYRLVRKLEAICEEQDNRLDHLAGLSERLLERVEELECKLKESDGRNSGVVYGHYMDDVNVAQVYTEQHEQRVEEPDVTMKDAAPVYLNPKYDGPVGP
jgi:hypothetical protein